MDVRIGSDAAFRVEVERGGEGLVPELRRAERGGGEWVGQLKKDAFCGNHS